MAEQDIKLLGDSTLRQLEAITERHWLQEHRDRFVVRLSRSFWTLHAELRRRDGFAQEVEVPMEAATNPQELLRLLFAKFSPLLKKATSMVPVWDSAKGSNPLWHIVFDAALDQCELYREWRTYPKSPSRWRLIATGDLKTVCESIPDEETFAAVAAKFHGEWNVKALLEWKEIDEAAHARGLTREGFMRLAALEVARKTSAPPDR